MPIQCVDRETKEIVEEKIYKEAWIRFLYENPLGKRFVHWVAKSPFLSKWYGKMQDLPSSKKKILPFIQQFHLDEKEFTKNVNQFVSFNDFFTRKLKPSARPIDSDPKTVIMPADGRYRIVRSDHPFEIKGQKFSLERFLNHKKIFDLFSDPTIIAVRLCPADYHRFHFPVSGEITHTEVIDGPLYSVNPIATKWKPSIYWENKREMTLFETNNFGKVLMVEVGATYVGSIHQTNTKNKKVTKGEEKGYFSFGGSCIVLVFQKDRVSVAEDLSEASKKNLELVGKMGQTLAYARH